MRWKREVRRLLDDAGDALVEDAAALMPKGEAVTEVQRLANVIIAASETVDDLLIQAGPVHTAFHDHLLDLRNILRQGVSVDA